ncbi:hypothetical protein PM1_006 [Pectobacterium phage PM1]|uniref:Uncharacterized protein n=1 Tax=Pectobacterium phage PM1 TaxID=1399915 RepID=X2CRN0_9CAUD|nr:hypothetical protein PM1_006 [Pectobacterium phage PM1]AGV99222.1 hypothetical protein PM1_006 [Pectobacterium phage PM1]
MNFGGKVKYIGDTTSQFTYGRQYPVVAGYGDGVPRQDGRIGAFIKDANVFVIEDNSGHFYQGSLASGNWKAIDEGVQTYFPNEQLNPIPASRATC